MEPPNNIKRQKSKNQMQLEMEARWKKQLNMLQSNSPAVGGQGTSPAPRKKEDPLSLPIRSGLLWFRFASGILALIFGGVLFIGTVSEPPEPMEALLLIVYSCVGLFWVASVRMEITIRSFALELLLFMVVVVVLRINSPTFFDPGKLQRVGSIKEQPWTAGGDIRSLSGEAKVLIRQVRERLAGKAADEKAWRKAFSNLASTWEQLPKAQQVKAGEIHSAMEELERAMTLWESNPVEAHQDKAGDAVDRLADSL